ncbi:ABC transporter ATP-binding protein [Frisingicoccus sp.]|uniref:ABC transporter ATP-binding protein n=1 Tax=Frisingicoccus sp. TaxID=1918627 RepID=UPI003865AFB5
MGLFLADMIFAMIGAGVTLIIPLIVRYITSNVVYLSTEEAFAQILRYGILMIIMVTVELGCNFFITYYGHVMGTYIERDLRNDIFGHYQKLSFNFFDNQKVGHLLSRVTSDLFDITELLHHGPEDIVISLIKIIGSFAILYMVNPVLAATAMLLVIIMAVFAIIMNKKMKEAFAANRARIGDINSQIEDSLSGIRVVKSFANETEEMHKFEEGNNRFVASKRVAYRYMGTYHSFTTFLTTMITVVSLIVGALLMTQGKLTATDLVTFLLYINLFTEPIKKLINFTEQFQNGYSGYTRFCEIMEIDPDIVDKPNALPLETVDGDIRFEDVSFGYQDTDELVLKDVNLHVKSGEYVALVGSSGVGKTTLCSLIPRFYDVSSGRILLDGKDIRDVKMKDLRRQIGIVQQDVYLFAGTIIENIRYGKPDATDEEVIAAAKAANAHDFIMNLDQGYQSDIGQRGVKLSGGQKQRISIARVFLKNPPILIFDEATSALDNESEKVVQESLEALAKNRTTFVIAHRLSTIRNAERIIVLSEEGVAEEGTHQELLEKGGLYAQLYEAGH